MRLRYLYPMLGFALPTLVIGYGLVIPRSCIAGWNELTVGFGATVLSACVTYATGIRLALHGQARKEGPDAAS